MATFTAAPANWTNASSDANFRAWGDYVSTQLAAMGLVQTADTGQIDWATVTNPGAINTYSGYEIWRFADSLQATAPVYIKIQYGEGSAVDGPGMRFQFGTGSDGAGNLTGTTSSNLDAETTSVTTACTVVGSGSTSRFAIAGGFNTGRGLCFSFERMKDAAGADTIEGVMFTAHGSGNTSATANVQVCALWNSSVGDYGSTQTNLIALFPTGSTMKTVTQTMVSPCLHFKGVWANPQLGVVGYYTADFTPGNTFVAYMYGATHTYYALPDTCWATGAAFQGPGGGTEAVAIRYE